MSLAALDRYPPDERSEVASRWGKRSAKLRTPSDSDWLDICRRNADNARGQVLREGVDYSASVVAHWQIVRLRRGRINQVDLVVNGDLVQTGRRRDLRAWVGA
jgi:hypothetical protein